MKAKSIIFPFSIDSSHFLEFNDLITDYEIIALIAPKGYGLTSKHYIDYLPKNFSIPIRETLLDLNYEKVILVDDSLNFNFQGIIDFLYMLPDSVEEIINTRPVSLSEKKILANICEERNFHLTFPQEIFTPANPIESVHIIKTPVVLISSIGDRVDKFTIQLSLKKSFQSDGYKISQIGSKSCSELFGFRSFPNFIFSNSLSFKDKILKFNKLIKHIEFTESPDIIIIGLPQSILPLSPENFYNFGYISSIVSSAVNSDSMIVSLPFDNYTSDYLDNLKNLIYYRFNSRLIGCNIGSIKIGTSEDSNSFVKSYTLIESKSVDSYIEDNITYSMPLVNIKKIDDRKFLYHKLIESLS